MGVDAGAPLGRGRDVCRGAAGEAETGKEKAQRNFRAFRVQKKKIMRLKNKATVNIYRDSMGRTRTVNHLLTNKKLPISYEHPRNYMRYVEEYRSQAAECALLAQKVSDLHDKALWLFMAEAWLWFGDDAAKLRGTVANGVGRSTTFPKETYGVEVASSTVG
jgi:hypothetical protein